MARPGPALVMSVFRCASFLCFDENPRGSTVAVRAVLLSKSECSQDTWIANRHGRCQILALCNVGVELPQGLWPGTSANLHNPARMSCKTCMQRLPPGPRVAKPVCGLSCLYNSFIFDLDTVAQ